MLSKEVSLIQPTAYIYFVETLLQVFKANEVKFYNFQSFCDNHYDWSTTDWNLVFFAFVFI